MWRGGYFSRGCLKFSRCLGWGLVENSGRFRGVVKNSGRFRGVSRKFHAIQGRSNHKMAIPSLLIGHFYPDFAQNDSVVVALCHRLCCYRRTSKLKAQGEFYKYDFRGGVQAF